jgi:hypothetical protein
MTEFAAELKAWLAAPRVQAHPDVSEILTRIRERAEPSLRAQQERRRQAQEAERLSKRLAKQMSPIVEAFAATGMAENGVEELESADPVFWRPRTLNMPTAIWQRGLSVTAHKPGTPTPWSSQGMDFSELTCAVGLEVHIDDTIRLSGGYVIGSMYSPEVIGYQEYVNPVGSSLQEKAVSDLFNHLTETLPKALERFMKWIEAGGSPPKSAADDASQAPP